MGLEIKQEHLIESSLQYGPRSNALFAVQTLQARQDSGEKRCDNATRSQRTLSIAGAKLLLLFTLADITMGTFFTYMLLPPASDVRVEQEAHHIDVTLHRLADTLQVRKR